MQSRPTGVSKGHAAWYVSVEAAAVCIPCVTRGALAAGSHGVADPHRTPLDVFHLVGPVAVTDRLLRPVIIADVDRILSSPPRNTEEESERATGHLQEMRGSGGWSVTTW